ncbi:MAG: outer membrane beta-barrel protein [Gemmataceae bacterium]
MNPVAVDASLLPTPAGRGAEAATVSSASAAVDRRFFMKTLQGTALGSFMDGNRIFMTGWMNASFTPSSAANNNSPITWNDRPNNALFQQGWIRLGRSLATSGTTDPSWGFQLDFLIGSDYRYTLPRGLWNSQLLNSSWDPSTDPYGTNYQNIYGVDLVQQYLSAYVPEFFKGTEFRVGRFYTPWGMESIEAVSTPLISRSYAFNWCPPFTHCGVGAYITFDSEWSAVLMAVNGNDVYWGDPARNWRFVGNVKWTQPGGGKNTVTLATSLGDPNFDQNDKFDVPGVATIDEAGGRTNMNAFDIVWTHIINPRLIYDMEAIYGYQNNVPGIFNSQGYGTAHWYALAHYLFWTVDPKTTVILRYENFEDMQGQRTGVDAFYTSFTAGLTYKFTNDVILRSEVRYDIANRGLPFDNNTKNQLLLGAIDLTVRW